MNAFLQWCEDTALSHYILSAKWQYPLVEIFHIAGLVLVFGSILVLNLRIFGRILREQPVSQIALGLSPFTLFGLCAQFVSGPMLFMATAKHFSKSGPFKVKLLLLAVALVYHFGVHRSLAVNPFTSMTALKMSATVSMLVWSGVVFAGLAIELLAE